MAESRTPSRDALHERRDQPVRLLIVCLPLGFVLASGILLAFMLLLFRAESISAGERLMRSIAGVTEEQTVRTIQNVEQTMDAARQKLSDLGEIDSAKEQAARAILREALVGRPFLRAIWVLDAAGRIAYDSDIGNIGLSLADRPYFKAYQENPATGFEITAPFVSRSTGEWSVAATKSWRKADGTLAGVVVAAIELKFMERVWNIASSEEISIALIHRNGTLLMVSPFNEQVIGRSFATGPLISKLLPAQPAGVYQNVTRVDNTLRILSYRTLSAYPNLIIVVGQTVERTLAPWRRYATVVIVGWLLASVALTSLSIWLFGEWRRRQATEMRYRQLFDANPHPTFLVEPLTFAILEVNNAAVKSYGWSRADFFSMKFTDLVAPADRIGSASNTADLQGGAAQHCTRAGAVIDVEMAARRIELDTQQAELVVVEDVTARNRVEREHRAAEAQLRQAQKMEAVGQLTGGVAHDFNNMLTVIIGNAESILDELPDENALRPACEQVLQAAEASAELTRRLLAFSRQQPLRPRATDVGRKVAGMQTLLQRTLGEHVHVRLISPPDVWSVKIDPVQLESAILNLAINARDAMPNGGKLTVEIANVNIDGDYVAAHPDAVAGDFVLVSVSDTGTGMTEEVAQRAFDPFFTTKDVGKGSGLGLSMVHGFVHQSGGHIEIESKLGQGSSIKMYLPRAAGAPEEETSAALAPSTQATHAASILVVEDDAMVRNYVAALLAAMGYKVSVAESGVAALALLQDQKFDLLFSDVVMPGGMTGSDLAIEARSRFPAMKVLLTSGYTQSAFEQQGQSGEGLHILYKPYRQHELAAKLREILEPGIAASV